MQRPKRIRSTSKSPAQHRKHSRSTSLRHPSRDDDVLSDGLDGKERNLGDYEKQESDFEEWDYDFGESNVEIESISTDEVTYDFRDVLTGECTKEAQEERNTRVDEGASDGDKLCNENQFFEVEKFDGYIFSHWDDLHDAIMKYAERTFQNYK